ncbi:hypothetical protein A5649_09795 [Mycolicibacter heraklionensis]|uniref:Phage capsid-like C-terminal domain-containing protein n=1 Tax=Mycolicibacter heraklionensis TaxID=512402 RepID=A0AA91IWH4_9MYCO|nr:phage major capsid protein [Mycolicibacter heraklionensis]OBK82138.1 hypothetical protein A5649_09795 [Mycolicibacter heraklionensis]
MNQIAEMTTAEVRQAAEQLLARTTGDLTGPDAEQFRALQARAAELRRLDAEDERTRAEVRSAVDGSGGAVVVDSVRTSTAPDTGSRDTQRSTALRTIERSVQAGQITAAAGETVEHLVTTGPAPARSWAQRWVTESGSDAYRSAFARHIADPERGHLQWTAEESAAWRRVGELQNEQRAMGIASTEIGHAMVPYQLDPSILLTSDGSTHPLLEISRVIPTVSDVWHGVSSAGVTAEWLGEGSQAADASPTLDDPAIRAWKASVFVPYSVELGGDAPGLLTELGTLMRDGADQLLAKAYTTGTGDGQPTGIITALTAVPDVVVESHTPATLAAEDVYKLQNALPARFQPNSRFMASLSVLNALRQLTTENGSYVFPELRDATPSLLGRPVHENSLMDGVDGDYPLAVGDFNQFAITQRAPSAVELIPHLFGANARPTGQRGLWLWLRTGADVLVPNAFRVLSTADLTS